MGERYKQLGKIIIILNNNNNYYYNLRVNSHFVSYNDRRHMKQIKLSVSCDK